MIDVILSVGMIDLAPSQAIILGGELATGIPPCSCVRLSQFRILIDARINQLTEMRTPYILCISAVQTAVAMKGKNYGVVATLPENEIANFIVAETAGLTALYMYLIQFSSLVQGARRSRDAKLWTVHNICI